MPDHRFFDDGAANLLCSPHEAHKPLWQAALACIIELTVTFCIIAVCFTFALGAILGVVAAFFDL